MRVMMPMAVVLEVAADLRPRIAATAAASIVLVIQTSEGLFRHVCSQFQRFTAQDARGWMNADRMSSCIGPRAAR